MLRAKRAALLSALVFPGLGQLYLRRLWRAALFMLPAALAFWYVASQVMARATAITDEILGGRLEPDLFLILERLERHTGPSPWLADGAAALMLLCWAASIADAWLAGRAGASTAQGQP